MLYDLWQRGVVNGRTQPRRVRLEWCVHGPSAMVWTRHLVVFFREFYAEEASHITDHSRRLLAEESRGALAREGAKQKHRFSRMRLRLGLVNKAGRASQVGHWSSHAQLLVGTECHS